MRKIDLKTCSNELHFPIIQALPIVKETNWFKRFFKFSTFRRRWKVMFDYCLWVPKLGCWIFIPGKFLYDGASVPKILNGLYSPTGMLLLGATPHDFGYRYEGLLHIDHLGKLVFASYSKKELDNIFDVLCAYESGMPQASKIAMWTLSLAGSIGWKENRKKNCVLEDDFPELFYLEDLDEKEQENI